MSCLRRGGAGIVDDSRWERSVGVRHSTPPTAVVIAVDGKAVRGSRTKTAAAIQLLAAMDHHGVVLAQRQVASKSNEIRGSWGHRRPRPG